ncbi:uncharacterized protein LOC118124472 [Hippoglossus stenolepis]|uniref:uncharacterized protein LOC118124472 n=1 Tax=Hippoglossus stenolepis TaxID=195615 RepID=UPI00159C5939|nr:uncharacterized protein LOC118124472 [Hippoglossus stenolepis]
MCAERRTMCAVQLLRVSVRERISAAAEDFLLQLEKGEETARVPALRALLTERLAAAAEEIVAVFEETVAEYEHRVERSEREVCRQRRLLDAVMKPEVRLHRADILQLVLSKAEVPPEQQQWSPLVDQEDPEPPHIKEEQKELRISQEGEQLQGLEEADIIKFTFTPVAVKREEDEETPQSSQLHQSQTENRANGRGPEPARNSGPDGHFQPGPEDKTSNCFEPVAENRGGDWKKTRESPSCFNTRINQLPCNTLPTVRLPKGLEKILANVGYVNGELLYNVPAASPLVAAATQAKPLIPQKRRRVNPLDDSRPYIKKPPNAFMLFRKEERLKVVAELNNANSATVNTIIGQKMIIHCPFCGSNLNSATTFCRRCGNKVRFLFDANDAATGQAGSTGKGALASFQSSKEAKSCFKKKTERKKKEPPKENLVKISVGMMQMTKGWLRAVRGMVLPVRVRPGADAEELLKAAKQKMKDFNTNAHVGPYVLLFADGTKIINVPGTETAFSLKLYKETVKKAYQRITVYLCTVKDYSEHLSNPRDSEETVRRRSAELKVVCEPTLNSTSEDVGEYSSQTSKQVQKNVHILRIMSTKSSLNVSTRERKRRENMTY